ncbi:Long chain acyl-CoA synthetase 6 peroxisomal [Zea mays]|uniref:4-coumarate--CoA ligase n=1 Tax=Zea mays TaxID=4577 RepID=A0A1D6IQW5_MAIZE|nr:Long chain acyl-CoA synthetase 6 peroxisomal [Zea mays]
MDAAQRRVGTHLQRPPPPAGGYGLTVNPTAAEYVHAQGYSVLLPEKLQTGRWNVYRSARSPLRLISRFPDTPDIGTLHDNFTYAVETFTDCKYLGTRIRADGTIGEPEWIIVDHACSAYSYVSVPLYDTLGPDAVQFIVNHAAVEVIFCVPQTLSTLLSFIAQMPCVRLIVVVGGDDANLPSTPVTTGVQIITYSRLLIQGKASPQPFCLPKPEDVATICYTSGTTGTPKDQA